MSSVLASAALRPGPPARLCATLCATLCAALLLGACATPSRDAATRNVREQLGVIPTADAETRVRELLAVPLTAAAASEIALLKSPRVAAEFAGIGASHADLVRAARLSNPVLSAVRISGEGTRQTTLGISQSLGDLLLLPARKHYAGGEFERAQQRVLREVQGVLADVQQAWFETTSAVQVASMRAAIAQAARLSAELAQRFFDAGNKSELDLAMERSAAAQASVSRLRAEAAATQSRLQLQRLMGLRGALAFQLDAQLPLPPTASLDADAARRLAMEQRFDLLAARRNIELHEAALGLARRWRWLGHVTIGAERERETSGSSSRSGPTLELALPIFDQGQGGIEAAAARLDMSRAALRDLEGAVEHEVESSLARVAASKQVVEEYSKTLVPAQQAIVERQQQRQNFMFIGQFELLLAKQQEYDVYQSYLEAVRDYWLARIEFARATGSALPGGESAAAPRIGVENMLGAAMEEQR